MLRAPEGRAILLKWAAFGAGVGVLGVVALAGWLGTSAPPLLLTAVMGALGGLGAWYVQERWRGLESDLHLGGPTEWEAEGRRLEDLKNQARHDPAAAAAYVAELESMVKELRDLRDHPPRGFQKLKLPIGETLGAAERDLAEARSLLPKGAA
jgi:hypothetical protein